MAYGDGTLNLSGNLNVAIGKPLDARFIVENEADLTSASTWTASGANYAYEGIIVYCKDTRKTMQLKGSNDYSVAANWVEAGSGIDAASAAHAAMPSQTIKTLDNPTASGEEYTMVSDGYFQISAKSNSAGGYFVISKNGVIWSTTFAFASGNGIGDVVPVSSGEIVKLNYANLGTFSVSFIYCNGTAHLANNT